MKKILSFVICSLLCLSIYAESIKAGVLKGPSGIPFLKMMDTTEKIEYVPYAQANLLVPKLLKNEIQVGVLPPNVAAKIYTQNYGAVVCAGIAGNGMLSIITKDKEINCLEDLKGKTLVCAGQGATPDFMIRYLMEKNGITETSDENGITLDFSYPNADIAAAVVSGKIEYALVPEPFATAAILNDKNIRRAVNIQDEFAKFNSSADYPMSVLVFNGEYAKANPQEVKKFIKQYKEAIEWTCANPIKAALLSEELEFDIGLTKKVIIAAVPECNYTWVAAKKGRKQLEDFLSILNNFDSAAIGETLPDDGFYFK